MFRLFRNRKKKYTFDFEVIGVDMHSHLIPRVDDGAKSLEDAIILVRGLKKLGFKKIITTPHVYQDYYPNSNEELLLGLKELRLGLKSANINIEVDCAAEYYMDETFELLLEKKELLTFGDNYVLVEMSFFQEASKLEEYLFKMQINDYRPILAHPERYSYYAVNFNRLEDLKIRGCKLQLNLLSMTGYYGKDVKDLAIKILDAGLYDFVGTDTHNINQINALSMLTNKKGDQIDNTFLNHTLLG